ncbi:filamentous hemagglutinin N-terminal domain-containing protein [Providencia sp. CIM-Carb-044]|uniref:two-partner secretion domain-containing protein n=1 Tax=Providencia sp. CIM-Carb-044 TaxID=3096048 RepID=UPI0024A41C75|nr:filamentous hemagglutinin N-terminal domain-containing protein [Providencia sp. CIM-Carb-044]MDX7422644.1 filamentous hemagglutinin N-terminal domain-containing protein [Providencia sp. CIM-Carb-044]
MKQNNKEYYNHPTLKLKPVFLGISIFLGTVSIAQADIVNTNGAGVIKAPNGATIVNIKTPSNNGVSHNIYSKFDVDKKGVVLNNSKADINTQLAGNIKANSNLQGNVATVILNEVNSNKATQLNGMIEVAGNSAQVIVANASGITCNNCGFINTNRATLTTGKITPQLNGDFTINVDKGQIVITDKFNSNSPTDILAKTAAISGKMNADEINIITGTNVISKNGQLIKSASSNTNTPNIAIDISALGGMYADKITLISTGNNSAISNKGIISAGDDGLRIASNGNIFNYKTMDAISDVNITATSNPAYAHNLSGIENTGAIKSKNSDININTDGYILNYSGGEITANQNLNADANMIGNYGGKIQATKGDMNIKTVNNVENSSNMFPNSIKSVISAGNELNINSGSIVYNNDALLTGRDITIEAAVSIENKNNALINAKRRMNLKSEEINNHTSSIKTTNGRMDLIAEKSLTNGKDSAIESGRLLTIETPSLINSGAIISKAGKSTINTDKLDNTAGYINATNLDINAENKIINKEGLISTNGNLVIKTNELDNRWSSDFSNHAQKYGVTDDKAGINAVDGSINIKANTFNNYIREVKTNWTEKALASGDVQMNINENLYNSNGTISAFNNLKLNADIIDNGYHGLISADYNATINAKTALFNPYGTISSKNQTRVTAPMVYNSPDGKILGGEVIINTDNYY